MNRRTFAPIACALAFFISGLALQIEGWDAVRATAVYAMTQLLGGVSPLPQGIGVAEGSGTPCPGHRQAELGLYCPRLIIRSHLPSRWLG